MEIAYIGSPSPLSTIPLRRLLAAGRSVVAIAAAGQRKPAPHNPKFPVLVEHSTSIASLALHYRIALIELTRDWSGAAELLVRIAPDVILVSCIGRKLPRGHRVDSALWLLQSAPVVAAKLSRTGARVLAVPCRCGIFWHQPALCHRRDRCGRCRRANACHDARRREWTPGEQPAGGSREPLGRSDLVLDRTWLVTALRPIA